MNNSFIPLGEYFKTKEGILVKTVCRGTIMYDDIPAIGYVCIEEGGCASEMRFMPEAEFKEII